VIACARTLPRVPTALAYFFSLYGPEVSVSFDAVPVLSVPSFWIRSQRFSGREKP